MIRAKSWKIDCIDCSVFGGPPGNIVSRWGVNFFAYSVQFTFKNFILDYSFNIKAGFYTKTTVSHSFDFHFTNKNYHRNFGSLNNSYIIKVIIWIQMSVSSEYIFLRFHVHDQTNGPPESKLTVINFSMLKYYNYYTFGLSTHLR